MRVFPTVVVQPPRNGRYGDAGTVVFQDNYTGNPRELAGNIVQALKRYVGKVAPDVQIVSTKPATALRPRLYAALEPCTRHKPGRTSPPGGHSIRTESFRSRPWTRRRCFTFPWKSVLALIAGGFSIPAIIVLVIWALTVIRAQLKAAGKSTLLDDEAFKGLVEMVEKLGEQFEEQEPAAKKRTTRKRASTKRATKKRGTRKKTTSAAVSG